MTSESDIIDDLGQVEISHQGLIHFLRPLRHERGDAGRSRSELIAMSFAISREALDADMGIALGCAFPDKNVYRLLGLGRKLPGGTWIRGKIPLDVLPFELHDAPCYTSCDFFNWVDFPPTLATYSEKIRLSLEKFRRFAGAVLQHELVASVEFRFTEYDEYGVEMLKLTCPVAGMVDCVLANITDVLDVPAMQVFVTR